MKTRIDVRGLGCPEPLMAFIDAAKKADAAEIEIYFDCEASRDNISRAASSLGWKETDISEDTGAMIMNLTRTP